MKKSIIALTACAIVGATFAQEQESAPATTPDSVGYTAIALGIATPVQLPWGFNWDVFGLDFNIFYSDANKAYGLDFAFGATQTHDDLRGLALSALFNYSRADVYGAKVALANITKGNVCGVGVDAVGVAENFNGASFDVIGSWTQENFNGFVASGIGNLAKKDVWGWQAALGANYADTVKGAQTALIFNMTHELKGAQLGLVNFAEECPGGFQIGLVNIILDNVVPVFPILNFYLGF